MPDADGKATNIELLAEVEDVIRTMPPRATLRHPEPENFAWLGRASAVVHAWSPPDSVVFEGGVTEFHNIMAVTAQQGYRRILTTLYKAKSDLRMKTTGPISVAIGAGMTFDYFDDLRKLVEQARVDLFFIDPYLDADFVARYLPFVAKGTSIRLLAREKLNTLVPAAEQFEKQYQFPVAIRSHNVMHDRYVFVDKTACYQSGASFKDGGIKPTTITQILDALPAMRETYEAMWNAATVIK